MKRIFIIFPMLLALAACETIEGAGEDLQDAGQVIEQEANETQAQL